MTLLTHPFGNANVRALLSALYRADKLARFITALGWSNESTALRLLPLRRRAQLARRGYDLPASKIKIHPLRETARLLSGVIGHSSLTQHEAGWASIDRVWRSLDAFTAEYLKAHAERLRLNAVYSYEDCAERSFSAARELGLRRVYDLPIAYWETARRLLQNEARRYPDWEPTLGATSDSPEKLARKSRELDLAEVVVCPSGFVLDSLPAAARDSKKCAVVPFGSPVVTPPSPGGKKNGRRALRFLFAGAMTQRKGLADVFAAMRLLGGKEAELVVMGSPILPMGFYRGEFGSFSYEPPRDHASVLRLMTSCDVLVLPSIVEGRALVQQEAMACGLPLLVTRNAGGEDLVSEGETGFLVPPSDPAALAKKMEWFLENMEELPAMNSAARAKAAELTWPAYGASVLHAIDI